jgi:hypothetical protein
MSSGSFRPGITTCLASRQGIAAPADCAAFFNSSDTTNVAPTDFETA